MLRMLMISAIALAGSGGVAIADDLAAGKTIFRKCIACHAVGTKARNKVGPLLNGLEGRTAGTIPGYNYSKANKTSGITWDEPTFLEYIKNPRKKIPGTKMVFAGIKKEKDARALWQSIIQFGPDGKKKS